VNSRVNPTFEKSDTGDPFFDVSGGAVFRVESEVFVPSCSAHPLWMVRSGVGVCGRRGLWEGFRAKNVKEVVVDVFLELRGRFFD